MHIERMLISDLRIVQSAEFSLSPGVNLFLGPNGAGKTSLLEAAHLLSYGRSFRSGVRDVLVRRGADAAQVFAQIRTASGQLQRLGIERSGGAWRGRVNDAEVPQLSDLYRLCPVACFEPGSHALVSGPAETRRAMLDWGVFHVEPEFLISWRRYQRALRQRNVLLREQAPDDWFASWESEMAVSAVVVDRMRRTHAEVLAAKAVETAGAILPEFSGARSHFSDGWKQDSPLSPAAVTHRLASERIRDRERGFTRRGPHRADWSLSFDQIPRREYFSRGQEKLTALTMVLAQMSALQQSRQEWPVLLLDDLTSELDSGHQRLVLEWIERRPLQVLMSGVQLSESLATRGETLTVFHVEQGEVSAHR